MLFLWEQAKDLCLCLFRWHHLPTILYTRYPAVLSPRPRLLLTQHWINDWLEISLKRHASGWAFEFRRWWILELLLRQRSSASSAVSLSPFFNSIWFMRIEMNGADLLMHQKGKIYSCPVSAMLHLDTKWHMPWFAFVVMSSRVVWSKWRIQVWEKSFCLTF